MEERTARMIFNRSGGTAGSGGCTTRVTIPSSWTREMGINQDDREITISFDGERITIEKSDRK